MMARGRFLEGTGGHITKVRLQTEPTLMAAQHTGPASEPRCVTKVVSGEAITITSHQLEAGAWVWAAARTWASDSTLPASALHL